MSSFKCPICGKDSFAYTEGELCPDCFDEQNDILLEHGISQKLENEPKKKIIKKKQLKD